VDLRAMQMNMDQNTNNNGEIFWTHPMVLAAKANSENNPMWLEAMNSPNKEGYWQAICQELQILTTKKDAWEVIPRDSWMNMLPSTRGVRLS
jgi:hypothetical protein